jgi:tRNA G18 (ribose-2'-O)-methylase SpoU
MPPKRSLEFNQLCMSTEIEYPNDAKEITTKDLELPSSYVILSNIQSGSNIGTICRNCLAFGVEEVLVIGKKDFRGKMRGADRGIFV